MVMSISDSSLRRRDLAGFAAAAAAAPALTLLLRPPSASAVSGAPAASPAVGPAARPAARAGQRIALTPDDDGAVVAAVDLPLAPQVGARVTGALRTGAVETDPFSMLAVTWAAGSGKARARVRRAGGAWTAWRTLPLLHDVADRGTDEARGTPHATEPVWVGACDGVQVEVTGSGSPVLTLIDPGSPASDRALAARRTASAPRRRPDFRTRGDWGADPRWASGTPVAVRTVKQVHVHHSASGNDYAAADVPGILRGIYRYHTKNLGWSDVGYNFFVDRFGVIWAGRRRPKKETQGAHTLGFNHVSVGIAVLGNYEQAAPTTKVLAAIARISAWKLAKYGRNAAGTIKVTSRGSDRYKKGQKVVLPVIDGHRDTNQTACPGKNLYAALPAIRTRTARRMRRFAR